MCLVKKTLRDYPDVLNPANLCDILDISPKTAYALLKEKKIASIRIGRHYKIPKKAVITYLNKLN